MLSLWTKLKFCCQVKEHSAVFQNLNPVMYCAKDVKMFYRVDFIAVLSCKK